MDVFDLLSSPDRRIRSLTSMLSTNTIETENNDEENKVARAEQLLRVLKLVLIIIAITLTIGRMFGWL